MRVVRWLLAALVLLLVGLVVTLAVALPRLAESDAVRATIESVSVEQLGRPLVYDRLSVRVLPPRIELSSPRVPGAEPASPALMAADRVELRIALLPLLALTVVLDSIEIHGPRLSLTRTDAGLDWPSGDAPASEPAESDEDTASFGLAIRRVTVRDGRIDFVDRTVDPPATLGLESIEGDVRGHDPSSPVDLQARAVLASGGRIEIAGTTTLAGVLDLKVRLLEVALGPLAAAVGSGAGLDATLTGEIGIAGPAADLAVPRASLVADVRGIGAPDVVVAGTLGIEASARDLAATPSGTVRLDATPLRIAIGQDFVKPPGTRAGLEARFAPASQGATEWTIARLDLASASAAGTARTGDGPTRLSLEAEPFALAGVAALVPAFAGRTVEGTAAARGLEMRLSDPPSLSGEIVLGDVELGLESGGRIRTQGRIVARPAEVELRAFTVGAGGQSLALAGRVRDPFGARTFELRLTSPRPIEADALLGGVDPELAGALFGPMTIDVAIAGRAAADGDERTLYESLTGRVAVDVGRNVGDGQRGGRVAGFSALGETLRGLEALGEMARIAKLRPGKSTPDLSSYASDEFESLEAHFKVHGGLLETEALRVLYPHYSLRLQGTLRLADQALDLAGEMTLGREVVASLGLGSVASEVVVPVAHVGGTLAEPDVTIAKASLLSLGTQLLPVPPQVKALGDKADEIVPGAGRVLQKGLQDILRGGGGGGGGASNGAKNGGSP